MASTNAVIAAICALETFKIASSAVDTLNNYLNFNNVEGIYTYAYEAERNENCIICCRDVQTLNFKKTDKLQTVSSRY